MMPKSKTPRKTTPAEATPAALPTIPPVTDFAWSPIATLRKWDKNPRNNAAAIPKVAASLKQFGFVSPIVVWGSAGRMVAGHTRLAALELILHENPEFVPRGAPTGILPGYAPVRFHEFENEEAANAYAIADNRLNEIAEWDEGMLNELLASLPPVLTEIVGFEMPELPPLTALTTDAQDEESTGTPPGPESTPPEPAGKERDPNARIRHYDLIFEDDTQQDTWDSFLKWLRGKYPAEATIAARLARHVRDQGVQ